VSLLLKPPKVSWLLATNSYDALTARSISSCLRQTFNDFELVIVCNGPQSDLILKQVLKFWGDDDRVRAFKTDIRYLNFSLALGLHYCRGEYVARMDADDVALSHRLAKQVEFLDSNPSVGVLGTSYFLVDDENSIVDEIKLPVTNEAIRKALRYGNPLCHPSVMFRRKIVCELGGYLGTQYTDDYELWVRLSVNSIVEFHSLNEPLVRYNVSPAGAARSAKAAYLGMSVVQVGVFFQSADLRWLAGSILSLLKSILISKQGIFPWLRSKIEKQ
jgi:glycosyltransferase involved in cell wall biosynthesis